MSSALRPDAKAQVMPATPKISDGSVSFLFCRAPFLAHWLVRSPHLTTKR